MERRIFGNGLALNGCWDGPVRFAFTERTGGVSLPPYASLNLGSHVEMIPLRWPRTADASSPPWAPTPFRSAFLSPTRSMAIRSFAWPRRTSRTLRASASASPPARTRSCARLATFRCLCAMRIARRSSSARKVASRWSIRAGGERTPDRGKAARALAEMTGEDPSTFSAYIGPHILGDEYEVSPEVVQMFSLQFDNINPYGARLLDMSRAICQSLEEAGVPRCEIHDPRLSTTRLNERFFSYRKENGICGRHAAVAMLR